MYIYTYVHSSITKPTQGVLRYKMRIFDNDVFFLRRITSPPLIRVLNREGGRCYRIQILFSNLFFDKGLLFRTPHSQLHSNLHSCTAYSRFHSFTTSLIAYSQFHSFTASPIAYSQFHSYTASPIAYSQFHSNTGSHITSLTASLIHRFVHERDCFTRIKLGIALSIKSSFQGLLSPIIKF